MQEQVEQRAMRICRKCQLPKDLEKEFGRDTKNCEGKNITCKMCINQYHSNRVIQVNAERNKFF
jgi:hypothetical protein